MVNQGVPLIEFFICPFSVISFSDQDQNVALHPQPIGIYGFKGSTFYIRISTQ